MKFSYNWLKELSGTKLSAQNMAELLTMHSFEVESVEKVGEDYVLNIDVLPNRTHDCLSHIGVAGEAAVQGSSMSGFRKSTGFPKSIYLDAVPALSNDVLSVAIQERSFGSRYLGVVIEGLKAKPAPAKIQERLKALGIRTINNVVDITNYVMLETGMPLHAFDFDKIRGRVMTVRAAKKGERLVTLDGKERVLPWGTLVIQDAEQLIDLAGTMGGANTAVSDKTTRVFLQAAIFDPVRIYRSTRQMNFRTEASVRYAAGLDPNLAEVGLMRAVELLTGEGGKMAGRIDIYPAPRKPPTIILSLEYVGRLLGVNVPEKRMTEILEAIGCDVKSKIKNQKSKIPRNVILNVVKNLAVIPPSVRLDLQTPEDLIEEIGRVIGYETIKPVMPVSTIIPAHETEAAAFAERVRDALSAAGMTEAYNYSLGPSGEPALENPISEERAYLRPSLVPGLTKNALDNLRFFEEVRMFEIGKIFKKSKVKSQKSKVQGKIQKNSTAVILSEATNPVDERWSVGGIIAMKAKGGELFYELKGIIDGLLENLGLPERWYDDYNSTPEPGSVAGLWQKGKTAEIKIGDVEIGFLGEVSGIEKGAAAAFELDMELLMKLAREEREYQPLPKYPNVTRDIAILVDASVRIQDVENAIANSGAKYIQDVDVFDIYERSELGDDRKSLAFHLIYQAEDHTLTDEEVRREHGKVERALEAALEAEIR